MNYYPKILPFYMTYPMPLIWEEEDTVMRDLEYLQELYPKQAKKYRKRIEELLERFDSEGSVLYDEYPDRMTLYKWRRTFMRCWSRRKNASRQRLRQWRPRLRTGEK